MDTVRNDASISISNGVATVPVAKYLNSIDDIKGVLVQEGIRDKYMAVRPVVTFPTKTERSVLCQGIMNSTVFNAG